MIGGMSMRTVSWIRAYHTRRFARVDETLRVLANRKLVAPRDDISLRFFDIQALRSCHFASAQGPDFKVEGALQSANGAETSIDLTGASNVLVHASGFLVL